MEKSNNFWERARTIHINRTIDNALASDIISEMRYLATLSSNKPIELIINSPGGSVTAGLAIIDYMQHAIRNPIIGIVAGEAASMASVIFIACSERIMLPHSTLMLHGISLGHDGQLQNVKSAVQHAELLQRYMYSIIQEKTGISSKKLQEYLKSDNYLTPEECLEQKICDKILK